MVAAVASLALGCTGEVIADAGTSVGGSDEVGTSTDESTGTSTDSGTSTSTSTSTDTDTSTGSDAGTSSSTSSESDTSTDTATDTGTDTGSVGPTPDLGVLAILDVNPTSTTFDLTRHPSDYPDQISAWYFGHAT